MNKHYAFRSSNEAKIQKKEMRGIDATYNWETV
jgi:hypothetical protein